MIDDPTLAGTRHRLVLRARQIAEATQATDLPSPCVSICRMDTASGLCIGCLRRIDEIAGWANTDDAVRRAVWQRIGERAAARTAPPQAMP